MRFHTKRYDIKKLNPEEFDTARYEVNLNDGYKFSDGSHLEYAENYEDLIAVIKDIEEER